MSEAPGYDEHLAFNAPLSSARADALAPDLAAHVPVQVLDVGCGWGELLLRILAAAPGATGTGWDADERLLARAQANARDRGLAERVRCRYRRSGRSPVDLLVCVGSEHVFGTQAEALHALHQRVSAGGRALLGSWILAKRPERPTRAAALGAVPADLGSLADLVELRSGARMAAARPADGVRGRVERLRVRLPGRLGVLAAPQPGHPEADAVRASADRHRPSGCAATARCSASPTSRSPQPPRPGRHADGTRSPTCGRSPSCSNGRASRPTG